MRVHLLAVIVLASIGCRGGDNSGDDAPGVDAGSGVDADPRPGCSMRSPRTVAPETFVAPTGVEARMAALIDSATDRLDIFMYLWTVKPLANRVVAAKNRGVDVRVILDPDSPGNAAVRPIFAAGGVPTRDATSLYTFSHAKYMIIDGEAAVIMSLNFNVDAMDRERNYGMIDRDPDDVADVQAIFDMDWAAAGGEAPQPADLSCTRLVVSPTNASTRLIEHIDSARETLELQIMYLSETTVRDAVARAAQRGAVVRVIIEDPTDDAIPALRAAGVQVKRSSSSYYLHAKLITADGVVFVGSENMSFTSLNRNREVGALVFEPAAAQVIMTQFSADWASGVPL